MIGRFATTFVDLVFPHKCLLCSGGLEPNAESFCLSCVEEVDRERREPACPTCAGAVAPYEVSNGRCSECRRHPTRLQGTVRVGPYGRALGQLLRAYKFHGRAEMEPVLGRWLAQVVQRADWFARIEAVVSVPTHWKHRLTRPLYAAEVLASIVAKRTGLPHPPILRRVRAGPHQIGLGYTARAQNVRGAFAMRKGVVLRAARLLLIDDVKTTGATLDECTKVLRKGGAAEVYGAVVVKVGKARADARAVTMI